MQKEDLAEPFSPFLGNPSPRNQGPQLNCNQKSVCPEVGDVTWTPLSCEAKSSEGSQDREPKTQLPAGQRWPPAHLAEYKDCADVPELGLLLQEGLQVDALEGPEAADQGDKGLIILVISDDLQDGHHRGQASA